MDEQSIYDRSEPIRACANGMTIGLDPVSHRYVYYRPGILGRFGIIAKGVKPEDFCK